MEGVKESDFTDTIRNAFKYLREKHSQIIVIGYSMGGALATQVLLDEPATALVLIAPMLAIRNPLLPLAPLAKNFLPWIYPLKMLRVDILGLHDEIVNYDSSINLKDPETLRRLREEIRFPVPITDELRKIQNHANPTASQLTLPTLVIQSGRDLTLDPVGAKRYFQRLAAKDKEFMMIEDAGHDIVKPSNPGCVRMVDEVVRWLSVRFG
jgi:alpha-beta hydrolase superfamily lysophospholipase